MIPSNIRHSADGYCRYAICISVTGESSMILNDVDFRMYLCRQASIEMLRPGSHQQRTLFQIGRASCRERGEISGVAGSFKKKSGKKRWKCDWSSVVCSSDLLIFACPSADKPPLRCSAPVPISKGPFSRSEERRVGKEGRSRGSPAHSKKKVGRRDGNVIGVQSCALRIC